MRIKVLLEGSDILVPINSQHMINSYVHKCLGKNNKYHDSPSDYNISTLRGGKLSEDKLHLNFKDGGYFLFSSLDNELLNKFVMGTLTNSDFGLGINVKGIDYVSEDFFNGWNYLYTLSPILLKEIVNDKPYNITLKDDNYKDVLKTRLINKLTKIDPTLNLKNFDIEIPTRPFNKTRKITVKKIINYATQCQINIHTNKKVMELLYNIGVGQSTGSGFGCVAYTKNKEIY